MPAPLRTLADEQVSKSVKPGREKENLHWNILLISGCGRCWSGLQSPNTEICRSFMRTLRSDTEIAGGVGGLPVNVIFWNGCGQRGMCEERSCRGGDVGTMGYPVMAWRRHHNFKLIVTYDSSNIFYILSTLNTITPRIELATKNLTRPENPCFNFFLFYTTSRCFHHRIQGLPL